MTSMWMRGTRERGAAELAHAIESIAAELDPFAGRNSFGLGLEALSERLEPALDLFAEVLLAPAFAGDELERERKDTLAALRAPRGSPSARASSTSSPRRCGSRIRYRLPILGNRSRP
jgi:predicted Zn-dependent peptidase